VQNTYGISCNTKLDVLRELAFVGIIILLSQVAHVVCYMLTKDVLAMNISVEFFGLSVEAREPLCTEQ